MSRGPMTITYCSGEHTSRLSRSASNLAPNSSHSFSLFSWGLELLNLFSYLQTFVTNAFHICRQIIGSTFWLAAYVAGVFPAGVNGIAAAGAIGAADASVDADGAAGAD